MSIMKFITVLLLFIPSVISAVCETNRHPVGEWFDPATKMCCGRRLSQRTENIDCCGGKYVYHSNVQICCNGLVYDKLTPRHNYTDETACWSEDADCVEKMCCGKELVSKDENTLCCNGNRVNLKETDVSNRDFFDCCGDKVFDMRNKMCCNTTAVQRDENIGCCDDDVYLKTQYKCVQNKRLKKTQNYCRQKEYDLLKHSCCDEHIVENVPELIEETPDSYVENPNAKCCGVSVIGKDQKCCGENRTDFPAHGIANYTYLECCGPGSYNTKTQLCLNGTTVTKSAHQAICGNQLIDKRFQKCCANKLPYNIYDQECCDGAKYCVINKGDSCCNGFKMNENELCCENRKPCKKRNPKDDGCCYDYERDNGQTFTQKNETCHNGQIYHIPKHFRLCGSRDFYNPEDQFCCAGKKYQNEDGQCCYGIYSSIPLTEGKCCYKDRHVYMLDDPQNPCILRCNKKTFYDPTSELCCEGRKYKRSGKNYCCGPFAIESDETWCCGHKFSFPMNSRKNCCRGKQVYNGRHFRCLKTGEVKPKRGNLLDTQKLCEPLYVKLFDGGIQQACRRNIAIRGKVLDIKTIHNSGDDLKVYISVTNVKTLKKQNDLDSKFMAPENITFAVVIPPYTPKGTKRVTGRERKKDSFCSVTHLNQLKKVIVLFDLPPEGIQQNTVNIAKKSPFFLTRHTYFRRYAITKAATEDYCKVFSRTPQPPDS